MNGKVALITGAAGLLGEHHASALAECGAKVILTDINEEALKHKERFLSKKFGSQTIAASVMDVSNPESIQRCFKISLDRFSGIHILVNNAALDPKMSKDETLPQTRFENFPLDRWNLEVSVGLTGAFLCCQVFGSWMAENGGGVILNISSDLSVIAPDQRLYYVEGVKAELQAVKPVAYPVVKTGLVGLTRYLASYWASKKIRVNALSPGGVQVDQPDEFIERIVDRIPMQRMAKPDEYRAAVQFLCSDASSYLTGQNIVMDGGRSII